MADLRHKDANWRVAREDGTCISVEHAELAVLMDIRDELKAINQVLGCSNFLGIPAKIERIARHSATIANNTKQGGSNR